MLPCGPRKQKEEPKSLLLMEKAEGIGVGSKGRRLRNMSEWEGAGARDAEQ